MVHVPASTNATRPDDELIVQIDVVELEYDFVPLPSPADAVEVIVGFVPASNAYDALYEPPSIDNVLDVNAVTVMVIAAEVEAEYVASPSSSARTLQEPVLVASAVKVVPDIEQYKVPDSTVYVVVPADPADKVVLSVVVPPTASVDDAATAVTVRSVLPVVKVRMSP